MAQISLLGALPDPNLRIPPGAGKSANTGATQRNTNVQTYTSRTADEAEASPIQPQIARLSAALNSLQTNVNNTRAQYIQALGQVKSGTYTIDPQVVSRSIVNDLLANQ